MSTPPPKHSLSSPTSANTPQPVLPTPSSSTTVSRSINKTQQQQRQELEQQLAEKQKQLQESSSGIGKNVLARQVSQLEEKLREMDSQSPDGFPQSPPLAGSAVDRLKSLERDLSSYRSHPLSPGISSIRGKDKLLNQRSPTPTGLDPLPSPTTSTLLPPAHGHDSTSLLPLPPPPTGSTPTKRRSKVPNTDRRNTDIEFATEIGQGLLLEVRKMQALLQEKEEKLRTLENQKADLERAAEAMAKQMRQREENEEKLKEETWNLELAKQELVISVTDLQTNLTKANAEQNKLAKQVNELRSEIEQLRDREEKLNKSIEAMKQRHEQDMSSIRRHAAAIQREKADQTKQIEALTSELAIAKAQSRIGKHTSSEGEPSHRRSTTAGDSALSDQGHSATAVKSDTSPSSSPPSSPKQSPARNQAMEVETLKSSLAHAHRMVNNLRTGLHKEKNEKFELKKLLAESQETIEHLQNDPRLWVDAGTARAAGSSSGPSSRNEDGSRRALKTNKRRGGKKNTFDSTTGKRKTKFSKTNARFAGDDEDQEEYSDLSDNEESDADSYDESDLNSPTVKLGGFTSLSSELSQGQKPIIVSTEVIAEPIEDLSMRPTSLADELATGSRSLGDELSSAMSRSSTNEEVFQKEKVQGIEISIQTDIELSTPTKEFVEISVQTDTVSVPSEISTQTEPRAPLEQKTIGSLVIEPTRFALHSATQVGIDVAPEDPEIASAALAAATAAAIASARQAAIESAIDVSTQSEAILTQDHETQSVPTPSLDQGVQAESFEGVDCGIQSETSQYVDVSVQSDSPVLADSKDVSVQHEELEESRDSAAAKVPFTEHVETVDESTQ
ncbi:Anucleate primary sterigmata protein A, partial [Choanephora cucurbitarum]